MRHYADTPDLPAVLSVSYVVLLFLRSVSEKHDVTSS